MKHQGVISDVVIESNKIQPSIVSFPNGIVKNEQSSKLQCGYFNKKGENILAVATNKIVYKGYSSINEEDKTYTMLGIFNKKTGKVRLINVERWQVSPILDKQLDCSVHLNDDKSVLLNKQFGSKKTKRRTIQLGKMKISIDAVKDQLGKTATNVQINKRDLTQKINNQISNNIPPCNRDAQSPTDVYNLYDIIPEEKLKLIIDKVGEISVNNSERSRFYVDTYQSIVNDSLKNHKIAVLEFIYGINKWMNMNIRDAKKKSSEISPFPEISNFIIETYSVLSINGRTRPITMRDKGIIHCIILALMINNFKLDLEVFSKCFHSTFGIKKLLELAKIVGAVPLKDDKNVIVLKVPLPPPGNIIPRFKKK
ncbi:DNA-directed RNA polymerase I subunit RPA49-like [Chelonus insularis]|uniref:DNA-directed RNA polymerase I subunit RPA49-like n=1 Tax=Chelonus insularis TaxID=460826 RepID=UPI00158D3D21|nr:DNA-directed RNA polymerase I subunit RPA49-like [Chelonus insularis]